VKELKNGIAARLPGSMLDDPGIRKDKF